MKHNALHIGHDVDDGFGGNIGGDAGVDDDDDEIEIEIDLDHIDADDELCS